MTKYIDAKRLIAEIKSQIDSLPKSNAGNILGDGLRGVLVCIASLQQEPKFKVGDTIHKIGENTVFPMTIERIYDGDYVCVTEHTQSFINIKFQDDHELVEREQSEVDYNKFEKLFDDFCERNKGHHITSRDACMWFWELGLKARKEDTK